MNYESFETRSTKTTTNDHYLYYSDTKYLDLNMEKITPRITSFPLFQHINYLAIYMSIIPSSSSNNSLNIVNSVQSKDNDYSQQYVTYLSHVVHLLNVSQIGFQSYADTSRWKDIQ
ncbi:unnamed protein product, partial [Rotaria sordida]